MEYRGSTQLLFYLHNPNEHIHLEKNVFEPRPLHSGTFEPNTFQLFKSYSEFGLHNAKVSVKRPVLLIDLV